MSLHRVNYGEQPLPRHERPIAWRCDECKGELETNTTCFDDALEILRENDWVSRQNDDGDWEHYCENCR